MATATNYPIHLPILVIEAQIFVAVKKFPFLPNKLIPNCQPENRSIHKNFNLLKYIDVIALFLNNIFATYN